MWRMRLPRVTCYLLKHTRQWTSLRQLSNTRRESLDIAHLEDASQRTIGLKRNAHDAHDRSRSHRELCRRDRGPYEGREGYQKKPGMLELVRDTASATHALPYGVPDRDSNETKYFREALKMIDEWQARCSRCSSEGHDGPGTAEVVLLERPQ